MRYGTSGDSGLLVSVVGLGCNNFGGRLDVEQTRAVVDAAIDEGITLFDTAETYGGGGRVGNRARRGPAGPPGSRSCSRPSSATRTPTWATARRRAPRGAATTSRSRSRSPCTRLKTDYIDLYQLHTPDPVTPIEETLAALDELVTEGKVRYLGHSNFSGWQIADAAHTAVASGRAPFISAQNHWSLLERDAEREVVRPRCISGSACCPTSRSPTACSPARSAAARGFPRAPGWPSRGGRLRHRRQARRGRGADRMGRGAGCLAPADRHRRPRRPAGLLLGDRRRYLRRPGPGQRGRGPVAALRRPARGHRQAGPPARRQKIKTANQSSLTDRCSAPHLHDPPPVATRRPRRRPGMQPVTHAVDPERDLSPTPSTPIVTVDGVAGRIRHLSLA